MTNNYKNEEYKLKKIIIKHVKPVKQDSKLKLNIYYKNKKLKNIWIKNNICENVEVNDSVLYKFACNERGCNASNIGYTQNTLRQRIKQHIYKESIKEHKNKYHIENINIEDNLSNTEILKRRTNKRELH